MENRGAPASFFQLTQQKVSIDPGDGLRVASNYFENILLGSASVVIEHDADGGWVDAVNLVEPVCRPTRHRPLALRAATDECAGQRLRKCVQQPVQRYYPRDVASMIVPV
ncbi:MAG: hypothetical protein M3Q03_17065 [Chloroflexota bacterium]|nr:hypothetical protein [Chloroflexota bacterium]